MKRIKGSVLADGHHHHEHHDSCSRRDFLRKLGLFTAGGAFVLGNTPVQALQSSSLFRKLAGLETDRVLVLIQLNGGNDGLNTFIPFENDIYYNARNDISIAKNEVIQLNDTMGMNPVMSDLYPLWEQGKMSVIQSVGYENGDLSHFRSTDIWLSASDSDEYLQTGWLGRHLDLQNPDFIENPTDSPLAIQIGGASSLLFKGDELDMGITLSDVGLLEYLVENGVIYSLEDIPETIVGDEIRFMRIQANNSYRYAEAIKDAYDSGVSFRNYGDGNLERSLGIVSKLIKGDLDTRIYLVTLDGFDTHANQENDHPTLLAELSNAVHTFYEDLELSGRSEEVLIATFSEFGRRVFQNGAQGTDHGTAAPLMIFGDSAEGGLIGADPALDSGNLDEYDNMIHEYDFRQVYATLLSHWFGLSEEETSSALGGDFETIPFIRQSSQVSNENGVLPTSFTLNQNYPNPFNPTTTISFSLSNSAAVAMDVFDVNGRQVTRLINRNLAAGEHSVVFDAGNLASGIYIYQLRAGTRIETKTMTLIK
ncbi:MAG: DUF1501 domain-containing protein [Balneolales bacterium]|nr:DUF1501 domain-containing protein [Balneolales bacterium]